MHNCSPDWAENDRTRQGGYGAAITDCRENEKGELWAGNNEYSTQVNFCPFCGYKAKIDVPSIPIKRSEPTEDKVAIVVRGFDKFGNEFTETLIVPADGSVVTTENVFYGESTNETNN